MILAVGAGLAEAKMKAPPTPEQVLQRKTQVFKVLDKNNDGRLTLEEYLADKKPEAKEQAENAFKEVDQQGKGLTLDQFLANYDKLTAAGVVRTKDYLRTRPFANIQVAPLAVTWQYSNDGGQTFIDTPHPGPPGGSRSSKNFYVWKGTFEVADPGKIAGLWVRLVEKSKRPGAPRATICNGDLTAAAGGYWRDLGFCPTLLDAVVLLNGKELKIANGPVLYFWLPLESELQQGKNTVELRGNVYSYWAVGPGTEPATSIDARLVAAAAQPAEIYNGPLLGDFGDGYFTLACRTQLPADLTVEATPTEPAGPPVTVVSRKKIWHRVKIEVPKGTRKLSYTLTARVGEHETDRGPYAVAFPGKQFRFVAFGNVTGHPYGIEPWTFQARHILESAQPTLLLNTGNVVEQGSWEFNWEDYYFRPSGDLLARVPTLITPCCRDFTGIFNELHYTPAADTYAHDWSKVVGLVRFIGLDGNQAWAVGAPNYQWLERELKNAREKFIVVLDAYPGYSGGVNSRKLDGARKETREVVLPLLGKYKASVMLCSWDPDYERYEPTPDKGVTQIVTGCIGKDSFHRLSNMVAQVPFGPGPNASGRTVVVSPGRDYAAMVGMRHFCVFDVQDDAMKLEVLSYSGYGGYAMDRRPPTIIDKKTFKPVR
jgi:hypothetical protein